MKIKRLATNAVRAACSLIALNFVINDLGAEEDTYNMYMHVVRGPLRTDPAFNDWSEQTVMRFYMDRVLTNDVGFRLKTEHICQPPTLTNESLWFVVRVTAKYSNRKLSLNMLRFKERSSDPDNLFASSVVLDDPRIIYTPRALGVIWGEEGERVNDTIINQGGSSNIVDEIVFIGMQSPYLEYSTDTEFGEIDRYLKGFPNFLIVGTCEVVHEDGTVLARGNRTVAMKGSPVPPILTLNVDPERSRVRIAANMESDRTAVILSRPKSTVHGSWTIEATVNAGDSLVREMDPSQSYFRAYLQ